MDRLRNARKINRMLDRKQRRNSGIRSAEETRELRITIVTDAPTSILSPKLICDRVICSRIICGHCGMDMRDSDPSLSDRQKEPLAFASRALASTSLTMTLTRVPLDEDDIKSIPPREQAFIREVQDMIRSMKDIPLVNTSMIGYT